ncbi:uncharacterized protein CC84DRAFT_1215741 [Paraphaeosphaeria sporulosa]|uniref:Uncharacterized protein n=1 Tax=Paraphaeosphaeria sporulosa TaxID=1460663 RepID=A0A177CHA1_9PLEO|nr:uncharacterized protein CC84DRAFT_1215741 [Paraphaeosphaeria sporulosa]OAG06706.1 hypothetical protein CC84DRAFT_1215741 [Paraphaeosphaeria sporulosa]
MGDIHSSEGNSDSKLLSNPNRGYYGKSYPGQRFFVQEPGPFGEKSTRGGTLMGWSFITTHGGKVTGYTSSYVFHKDGKQPNFAIEDGEMAVYNGKRKGKESENPSSWRRLSDSRLVESVAQMRKKTLKADGWTMIAPHEWAIEEMPRKMSVAPESPSEGSASKETSESKGDRKPQYQSAPIVSSSSKESLLQRSADEDTELFESLFSKKRRKEHAEKFFMSLLAKGQPWLGARSSLAHPIVFDPNVPWEMLPYKAFTHTTPQCAALGHFLSRSETDKPTNPLMKSPNFTIIIRDIGRFDHTGRQPGLMIQATNFSIRQLDRGFVPGERRVEIWRNGETFCFPGVIAVMADRCAWFLGDEELRRGEWIMEMEKRKNLVSGVGLGQP